jgi:hypothetical protein
MWQPITHTELQIEIKKTEHKLTQRLLSFWEVIKITPEKWKEDSNGVEGGGFWVVAIFGKQVIWYNDIEDGFNISAYTNYGEIDEYKCNQDEISWIIKRLFDAILTSSEIISRGGPEKLD